MKPFKAFSIQMFGAKYQRIRQSLLFCTILFLAPKAAEIHIVIAPSILFLTATLFTAGIMWQVLSSNQNEERMRGMFLLPFENRQFTVSYVAAFGGYTLVTKTALVLAVFLAVCRFTVPQIITALLCACNGCFMAAAWYLMIEKKRMLLAAVWAAGMVSAIFFVRGLLAFSCITVFSLGIALWHLLLADAYEFCRTRASQTVVKRNSKRGSIFIYLLRYLLANRNYLINTAGLCAMACFLPFLLGQFRELNAMPLGFAVLCLNTPLGVLLSGDARLEQAVRILPRQVTRFCTRYCFFIFFANMAVDIFYLCSWQLQFGDVDGMKILTAVLFAFQSAIFSVLLEWLNPLRGWRIEADLWHHPRKYIVPLVMMFMAFIVSAWTPALWIWLCILLAVCAGLVLKTGGI